MRRRSPFTFAILGFVAISAGCSRLAVEWTLKPHEISVTAHGFTNADLLILAGHPSGPMLRRETPEVWSTVGPLPGESDIEVARGPFDETGTARVTVLDTRLPPGKTLIQALVLAREGGYAMAVSDCMAVTWNDGVPSLRHHALDVLMSPVGVRLLVVAALVLGCFLLRRLEVKPAFGRGPRLAVVFLVATFLFLSRLVPPERSEGTRQAEPPPPLWPAPVPSDKKRLDPLDRVTTPGLRELVDNVRSKIPAGTPIAIMPAGDSGEAYRDAWQTAWLVWPHRAEILKHDVDPFERRGAYLILGDGPKKRSENALFRNQAGAVWSIPEGEPR